MPLNIYTSNRMENLVEALADAVRRPLGSPFTAEILVVQSKGMQRWLAMELAGRLGVWANCQYPFPNKMAWQLFAKSLPGLSDASFFSAEAMAWKIMGLLPQLLEREEFAPLSYYLQGDGDGLKRFQLAGKIADTFDQYTFFRPEMLLSWEEGKGGDWQEILWRELSRWGNGQHRGRLKLDFLRLLAENPPKELLPERINVFGISYLPKYHLEILAQVGNCTEVNLLLLSPCREYWGDIASSKEIARRKRREREYLTEGNPLLASLGKLAREFAVMMLDAGDAVASELDRYRDPGEGNLLAALQSDILNLRGSESERAKRAIAPADLSVQIHSCHSPMREIEVLHDNLLALLAADPGLACRDIVVMTPEIEKYAPYIAMVFEGCQDPARKLPFSIADRSLASEGEVAGVLLKLLALADSRLTATAVFDLLESAPVQRRFGLDAQELDLVRGWIEETRIRWGADEAHRLSLGLPPYRDNSWRAGLDRLLLGYAMPEEGDLLFHGILPYDEMEGNGARTLGKFAGFVRRVERLVEEFGARRTLPQWQSALQALLADFVDAGDDLAHEVAAVGKIVNSLEESALKAGFEETTALPVMRAWLSSRLSVEEKGFGFLTGAVTFCAMIPMRSIPFRVVALIGMNDSAFPRQSRPPGFDLIARNPEKGDRSLRDEDRYLFLECLLSARDCFYLSYVGQSVKDNGAIPPSVLVSEFLDAIDAGFHCAEERLEERLVTRHRLQAFSRSYFSAGSKLFSYSAENCQALNQAEQGPKVQPPFIAGFLPEPPEEMRELTLSQLLRFFGNPARYLLENRLEIRLGELSAQLEEREAFALDRLEGYGLNQQLLEKCLRGGDCRELLAISRCRGLLPPARHGELVFEDAVKEVRQLATKIEARTAGLHRLAPFDFEESIGEFRLSGRVDGIWTGSKISYRCAKLKAKDELSAWIEHLVLNAFAPEGYPRESLLVMTDEVVGFRPVERAAELLASLLDLYWQGLQAPLRFFPASSREYVRSEGDLEKARNKWESGFFKGEQEDPYFQLCFGQEQEPLGGEFGELAWRLLTPMAAHKQ